MSRELRRLESEGPRGRTIFWFDISVDVVMIVHEREPGRDLLHNVPNGCRIIPRRDRLYPIIRGQCCISDASRRVVDISA